MSKTAFPVYERANDYHARDRNGRAAHKSGLFMVRGIADEAQEIVEQAQPYHNEQGVRRDPLWLIHHLNNIDKHRTVHLALTYPFVANTTFNVPVVQEWTSNGPFSHGSVIAAYSVENHRLDDVIATTALVSQVLIAEGDPPIERPLGEACQTLLDAVSNDYLPHLTPFL